jgi:hypothetical protein
MEISWPTILASAGVTAGSGVIAALTIVYVGRRLIEAFVEARLADYKAKLNDDLERHKADLQREHASFQAGLETENARLERVRIEIEKWANPITDAVNSLEARLANILKKDAYVALGNDGRMNPSWAITYEYFMPSTIFLFAQFFCWQRLLEESLRFDLFHADVAKDTFLAAVRAVGRRLGSFPIVGAEYLDALSVGEKSALLALLAKLPADDRQVFALQQRAMGEILIFERTSERVCLPYAEFLTKSDDAAFAARLEPMRQFLEGLEPDTRRWLRLELVRAELIELKRECHRVLTPREKPAC